MGGSGFYFCCGLSPLARGTLSLLNLGFDYWRFIPLAREHPLLRCQYHLRSVYPAGAGNTPAVLAAHYSTPVYPAGAGTRFTDYIYSVECRFIPLARGTRQFAFVALHTRRFIRWRGNTVFNSGRLISSTVYPAGAGTPKNEDSKMTCKRFIRWRGNTCPCYRQFSSGPVYSLARGTQYGHNC
ncbi:hypothetical protein IVZ55_21550 [Salmonella enterica subsp. enterica serovar Worthington]|nr:hypothetical protein [Salmonella enterica subsp. enterica serovar Worthington]